MKTKIIQLKNIKIDFYNATFYKNSKEDDNLMVFTTINIYIIDIFRRDIKAAIEYSNIKLIEIEGLDKIRLYFKKGIASVYIIS